MAQESNFFFRLLIIICLCLTAYSTYTAHKTKQKLDSFIEESLARQEEGKALYGIGTTVPKITFGTSGGNNTTPMRQDNGTIVTRNRAETARTPQERVHQSPEAETKERAKVTRTSSRAVPSAKVRINDRYVEGKTYLPEGKFTEKGTVTVAIYVDFLGTVSKTEISSATIQDEDVQYACREAALKTRFSLDVHAGHDNLLKGTILYEFK